MNKVDEFWHSWLRCTHDDIINCQCENDARIALEELLQSVVKDMERKTLQSAIDKVVADCQACNGQGFTIGTGTEMGHGCGGDYDACQMFCPIPIPMQTQEQCEYCGRPASSINSLKSEVEE